MPSEVSRLTMTTSVSTLVPHRSSSMAAELWVSRAVPSTPTSPRAGQGDRSGVAETPHTQSHVSLRSRVTVAPVSTRNDTLTPPTVPSR